MNSVTLKSGKLVKFVLGKRSPYSLFKNLARGLTLDEAGVGISKPAF